MTDTDREARILELRRQIENGEYQIDNKQLAARLIGEHLLDERVKKAEALTAKAPGPLNS